MMLNQTHSTQAVTMATQPGRTVQTHAVTVSSWQLLRRRLRQQAHDLVQLAVEFVDGFLQRQLVAHVGHGTERRVER